MVIVCWRCRAIGVFFDIFITFARIGALTFGGGYAVLPLLQKEAVEKNQWVTQTDVVDYYAVGQCMPGMIGVNTVILIGYKVRGRAGAVAAACGFAVPSLLIILGIASLIQNVADQPVVQHAFAGVRVAVCALIVNTVYRLARQSIVNAATACIAAAAFVAAAWLSISPIPIVLIAAAAGIALSMRAGALQVGRKTGEPRE